MAEAIEVRGEPVNGTGAENAELAALARERELGGVVYVTARSHSARARWMLGRALAPGTAVAVRAPREDSFDPAAWWRSRDDARELLAELGRWANVIVLRDAWSSPRRRPFGPTPADRPGDGGGPADARRRES